VEALRLDRGVGRDPAIGRPEAVAAFEPPAVALGVEVGGQVARSLRLPARASGSTRQQVLIPGDSLARAHASKRDRGNPKGKPRHGANVVAGFPAPLPLVGDAGAAERLVVWRPKENPATDRGTAPRTSFRRFENAATSRRRSVIESEPEPSVRLTFLLFPGYSLARARVGRAREGAQGRRKVRRRNGRLRGATEV